MSLQSCRDKYKATDVIVIVRRGGARYCLRMLVHAMIPSEINEGDCGELPGTRAVRFASANLCQRALSQISATPGNAPVHLGAFHI